MKNSQFSSPLASVKNTAMKTVMSFMVFFSLMSFSTAQTNPCCKELKITGQKVICRADQPSGMVTYTITAGLPTGCSTSPYYTWTVAPNTGGFIACSQGGTSTNFNIAAIPAAATSLTITVGTFCNGVCYFGSYTVLVSPILNASFNMSINAVGSTVSITATPVVSTGSHYWLLYEANCTTCTPISAPGFPKWGTTPTYTYSPLTAGKCYVLYHYHYDPATGCWTMKRRCFNVTPNARLAAQPVEDNVALPAEFQKDLKFLQDIQQRRD